MSCWNQLVALLFGQLAGSHALRDLVNGYNSKSAHHDHLGTRTIHRSSWSDANSKRPTEVFQETFFYLLEQVRNKLPKWDASEMVRLIDSSTIDLHLNQFEWADFRSTKAGIKWHTVYDPKAEVPIYFAMTNAKVNAGKALHHLPIMAGMTYVVECA
jgi:putative transposase